MGASASNAAEAGRARLYVQLALAAIFWGGTFIAGRRLALELPHFVAAAARYAVAAALLLVYLWRREGWPRPTAPQALGIAVLGATGIFGYNAFFFAALSQLPAGRTALIIAANPALTAVGAWLFFRLRFAWWQWLGVATAFAGVAIVVSRGNVAALASGAFGRGELLMLCGVLSWVAYTLVGRALLARPDALSPLATTAYASTVGLLQLAAVAAFELPQVAWHQIDAVDLAAIAYLGVFGTALAFVWYYEGVKRLGAAHSAVFINLVPVTGVALAVLLLGEPLTPSMALGGLIALCGVTLTNYERRPN